MNTQKNINIYEKTKKFLYTLFYEYNVKPRKIERSLIRGTLPTNVEYQIINYTSENGKLSESIKNIRGCRRIDTEHKIQKLKQKGWIYDKLPKEIEEYYKKEKDNISITSVIKKIYEEINLSYDPSNIEKIKSKRFEKLINYKIQLCYMDIQYKNRIVYVDVYLIFRKPLKHEDHILVNFDVDIKYMNKEIEYIPKELEENYLITNFKMDEYKKLLKDINNIIKSKYNIKNKIIKRLDQIEY